MEWKNNNDYFFERLDQFERIVAEQSPELDLLRNRFQRDNKLIAYACLFKDLFNDLTYTLGGLAVLSLQCTSISFRLLT